MFNKIGNRENKALTDRSPYLVMKTVLLSISLYAFQAQGQRKTSSYQKYRAVRFLEQLLFPRIKMSLVYLLQFSEFATLDNSNLQKRIIE